MGTSVVPSCVIDGLTDPMALACVSHCQAAERRRGGIRHDPRSIATTTALSVQIGNISAARLPWSQECTAKTLCGAPASVGSVDSQQSFLFETYSN